MTAEFLENVAGTQIHGLWTTNACGLTLGSYFMGTDYDRLLKRNCYRPKSGAHSFLETVPSSRRAVFTKIRCEHGNTLAGRPHTS